jgi:hypothetical protein
LYGQLRYITIRFKISYTFFIVDQGFSNLLCPVPLTKSNEVWLFMQNKLEKYATYIYVADGKESTY